MVKPTRRRISPLAREHINEARQWKASAGEILKKARGAVAAASAMSYAGRMILTKNKLEGANRATILNNQKTVNRAVRAATTSAKIKLRGARKIRETARAHIGAAKEVVQRENPLANPRGRKHRNGNLF